VKPLKEWSKNDLVREVTRLRAVLHEHSKLVGDDPRGQSTDQPIIGGTPTGHGDALLDARAAVLLEGVDVVLVNTKRDQDPVVMMLTLRGRINYAEDVVTHAYLFNGDGAAAITTELIMLAGRAAGAGETDGKRFAEEFKRAFEQRMEDAT
jgi:hypothetical protein